MRDSLYRNSIFLIANTAALGAFSFAFWLLAARLYSANDVGTISAVVSAATLLASLSFFGFDYAFIKFIPGSNAASARTHTGLTFTAILSIITSIAYLILVPVFIPKANLLISSPWWMLGFIVLIIATTWNTLTNSIFIAHRITQFALIATIVLGLIRIPVLFLFKSQGAGGLLIAQFVGMTICVILCFAFLYIRVGYSYRIHVSKDEFKHMASYALGSYLSNVSGGLPALILPTIILKLLGGPAAAYFFIANQFAYLLYIIPSATSQSLLAEGAWKEGDLGDLIKRAVKLMSIFVFPSVALMITLGWILLSLFGKAYATSGYWMLFFFSITTLPKMISYLFSTVLRINSHIKSVVIVASVGTIMQLLISYVGMRLTTNLITLGIAALACEVFVATSYTVLFLHHKKEGVALKPDSVIA